MAEQKKTWEQLYTEAQGAQQAQQQTNTDVGKTKMEAPKVQAVNPAGITQSFYTTPTTAENAATGRPQYAQSEAVQQAAQAYQ